MEYNNTNIEEIAWKIVEDMTRGNLEQIVYEDMVHIMKEDEEVFHANVEIYKKNILHPMDRPNKIGKVKDLLELEEGE